MMAAAVRPIAMPIATRRATSDGIAARTGDDGCSRAAVTVKAESMNAASPAPSITYSGHRRGGVLVVMIAALMCARGRWSAGKQDVMSVPRPREQTFRHEAIEQHDAVLGAEMPESRRLCRGQ